jgi:hypothetical protein
LFITAVYLDKRRIHGAPFTLLLDAGVDGQFLSTVSLRCRLTLAYCQDSELPQLPVSCQTNVPAMLPSHPRTNIPGTSTKSTLTTLSARSPDPELDTPTYSSRQVKDIVDVVVTVIVCRGYCLPLLPLTCTQETVLHRHDLSVMCQNAAASSSGLRRPDLTPLESPL